jgi:rhamnogalacturonyl hydrolase YesR
MRFSFPLAVVPLAVAFFSSQVACCIDVHSRPSNYSTWMALSIVSRGQGLLGSSSILQAGFAQTAFRRIVEQYPHDPATPTIAQYIRTSVESVAGSVTNATEDLIYPLDRLSNGNNLINLYQATGNKTYRRAFQALRESINLNSRNVEGGLWYFVYPQWSYLDGMYSLVPFYAYYNALFDAHNATARADLMSQLDLLWQHCHNNSTGLLVHGYDESRSAVWADPITGASPHVWGRSLGWYTMALVDTIEILPLAEQLLLRARFRQLAGAVREAVDSASGGWWQLLDQPGRAGNYIESSGSAMFVYALLKGVRLGYLDDSTAAYTDVATRAYGYIVDTFVVNIGNGTLGYNGTVSVCSLNSTASYEVWRIIE